MIKGIRGLSQLVTNEGVHKKDGRRILAHDLGIIENAAVVFDSKKILWVGKTSEIPNEYKNISWDEKENCTLTPEIVDSHTHLVFAGNRASEYSMRLNGENYQKIAATGGGILSTMRMTNSASRDELFHLAVKRVEQIHSYGVGTIEIKSGYGLNLEKEIECSEIIHDLKLHFKNNVQIVNTFMAAHAIPKTFADSQSYLNKVVYPTLEKLIEKGILDCADIFHEVGYFNSKETEEFFKTCKQFGLAIKSHADEFSDNKGALLACQYDALSTDHLLCTGADGIDALVNSNTVATLLPGTGFFLGKPQSKAREMLDAGAKVALASDYNPGSCHCDNLLLIASLAAPTLKMNLGEIWAGITYNAAHAVGLKNQGLIAKDYKPRFSIFDTKSLDEITYQWGINNNIPNL